MRSDETKREDDTIQAMKETWARLDDAFAVEPAPLSAWTALVRERKRLAKRKLWRDLAILWSIAIPAMGLMLLLVTGMPPLFWMFQAAAAVAGIPWLVGEIKRIARSGGRRTTP
ncbi:YxlC family protein [Cohnella sp. CFH 77786]|uniref:YxlC family protein n=1 Tax=Cohnella sp. CFH 77786 TaxID=2662265 RepID=UPI00351D0620